MTERDHLLVALVAELLGPRGGPEELLPADSDPRNEYITGVLAPFERDPLQEPEATVEEISQVPDVAEEAGDDEDQGAEGVVIAPDGISGAGPDPRRLPRSCGLSFVVRQGSGPETVDVCATWARYHPAAEGAWRRHPRAAVTTVPLRDGLWDLPDAVRLYARVRPAGEGRRRVSLYLVNATAIAEGQRAGTPDHVFQPQLRVRCPEGSKLAPVDALLVPAEDDAAGAEEVELAMLYRKRLPRARGHMCGALWEDIDPERPCDEASSPDVAPFAWTDAALLDPADRARFSPADARTEFLPCYPVESPEMGWDPRWTPVPELDPLALAECWDEAGLRAALEPLVRVYGAWLDSLERKVDGLLARWHEQARSNIARCRGTARRMQDGIEWLIRDEDVRLSFCFANRAIALQSTWARGRAVPWRPFQLAFILLTIGGLADPAHEDRQLCDLLWFPTGGGKTEAYLGLAAFTLALRRRRARAGIGGERTGGGVAVLSRYTLRLLTIQQFRRALGLITACEVLRVDGLGLLGREAGWRPSGCAAAGPFAWGGLRFSAGLWVGGGVTPNSLLGFDYMIPGRRPEHVAGALEILQGLGPGSYEGPDAALRNTATRTHVSADGEPAQVLTCPACRALLAVPRDGLRAGPHTLHFVCDGEAGTAPLPALLSAPRAQVDEAVVTPHGAGTCTVTVRFAVPEGALSPREVDRWWRDVLQPALGGAPALQLLAARPARPGYFLSQYENAQHSAKANTFEIYCPDPGCPLNAALWAEQVPVCVLAAQVPVPPPGADLQGDLLPRAPGLAWQAVPPRLRWRGQPRLAARIPIPACTIDDQVYHRLPSLVIATVDKFARLAHEPRAAGMFGHVTHYHARWGYYRAGSPPNWGDLPKGPQDHPPGHARGRTLHVAVPAFLPPDLIIQDELHLIEGPLGSMVGLYETAVDALSERMVDGRAVRPKYVASTATVRQAESQVRALFDRQLALFPPSALTADDRFFARTGESHPLESERPGRLYVAVCAPGKGAQTPIVRIWSALLAAAGQRRADGVDAGLDGFWTLVGYFNALRELAGSLALYRQDIRQRLLDTGAARALQESPLELSSRADSLALPGMLERLEVPWGEDAVLATSMFGTGVDVDRLRLMVVHGQPKTTSAYIQATGRVGRQAGGLVVSFLRASRPRDLDHYEFFSGYHRMLYRAVEPVTVTPYAPRARERGLGPLSVALLRQARQIGGVPVGESWHVQQKLSGSFYSQAVLMGAHRQDPEVRALAALFEGRAAAQPDGRRPQAGRVTLEEGAELDRWAALAHDAAAGGGDPHDRLVYQEPAVVKQASRGVILGDAQHQNNNLPVAYENAPSSLRDVEETTRFRG